MVTAEQALGGAGDGHCCTRSRGGEWRAVHVSLTQESQLRTRSILLFHRKAHFCSKCPEGTAGTQT